MLYVYEPINAQNTPLKWMCYFTDKGSMAQNDHIMPKITPAGTQIQINLAPEPVLLVTMLHWFPSPISLPLSPLNIWAAISLS